jgi:hypothetical protein
MQLSLDKTSSTRQADLAKLVAGFSNIPFLIDENDRGRAGLASHWRYLRYDAGPVVVGNRVNEVRQLYRRALPSSPYSGACVTARSATRCAVV